MHILGLGTKRQSTLPATRNPATSLPSGMTNQLYDALYRFYGGNTPIWLNDNLEEYIKKGFTYNSDCYSIINYIVTTAAPTIWTTYRRKNGDQLEPTKPNDQEAAALHKLMRQPNPMQGRSAFWEALFGYKLLIGTTYGYKMTADKGIKAGVPLEVFVMPAHIVEIIGGGITNPISGYRLRYAPTETIPADKVAMSKFWNPDDDGTGGGLYGLSPVRAAARLITMSNESFSANTASFQNMGATGIISQPVQMQTTPEGSEMILTTAQMDTIKRTWQKEYAGAKNFNKIAFTSAAIEYHQLGLSPVDMAILGSQELSFEQLCGIWKFPSELLRSKNSTYNTRDAAKKSLYEDVIIPGLNAIAEDLYTWLVKPFAEDLVYLPDFSAVEVLQANKVTQVGWLKESWWLTPNEKRIQMDYGTLPDPLLDKVYIPSNLIPLEDAAAPMPSASPDLTEDLKALEMAGILEYASKTNGNGKH